MPTEWRLTIGSLHNRPNYLNNIRSIHPAKDLYIIIYTAQMTNHVINQLIILLNLSPSDLHLKVENWCTVHLFLLNLRDRSY